MTRQLLRAAVTALLSLAVLAPPAPAQIGPDHVASENVELIGRLKTIGDGVGATIIKEKNLMFVTSTQSLEVYDITNAEEPERLGSLTMNIQFENEEVPTNGKVLGISSDTYCVVPSLPPAVGSAADGGCLSIYDVSDPANPTLLTVVPGAGNHTSACILDCKYMYGDGGTITDLTDPAQAKIVGDWQEALGDDYLQRGCHHVREISPGIILGSCQPLLLMSVRPEDGGSPLRPKVLATGANEDTRFIHSSRWPRDGRDRFMLAGGERNAQPQCGEQVSAFMTWDGAPVINPFGGYKLNSKFLMLDEVRPENGTYADGHSPYNALGCSVHWFMEHPTFKNGGLVALAEYENGTRFLQIDENGKITEQGFFLPLGGSTSAPHWHPNGQIVYNIDYTRGIDVLRWKGETYVPGNAPDPSAVPGTGGAQPDAPACASAAGFRTTDAKPAGRGLELIADRRQTRPFTIDVFQTSTGRRVMREKRVARFVDQTQNVTWNGKGAKADGFYFARFTMQLADGGRDVRRVTLQRKRNRFKVVDDHYQRTDCGVFRTFKLSGPAFGGSSNRALGISYRLAQNVGAVRIEARVGKRVVKRWTGRKSKDKTYRLSLPARLVRRNQQVEIRVTVTQGSAKRAQALASTRL